MRRLIAPIAYAILFASLAATTLPKLVELTGEAMRLRAFVYPQRRFRTGEPGFYAAVTQVASTLPHDEPLALILNPEPKNIGLAMFADYYLYPRPVKLYYSRAAYNLDKRPGRPASIAYMQYGHEPVVRRATYEEIRAEEVGSKFVVGGLTPSAEGTSLIVPVVASADGPPPDVYTCEGVIVNANPTAVRVGFELFPARSRISVVMAPGETRTWNDLVYQVFGTLAVGWMRVDADRPIRLGVWFVNRGIRSAAPVRAVEHAAVRSATFFVPRSGSLWVINPGEHNVTFASNGESHRVDAESYSRIGANGNVRFVSAEPVFAFTSWRDESGRTLFGWPAQ